MTAKVFTWRPNIGAQRNIKPNVNAVKFGNGYELRVPDGLNTMPITWDGLTFTGTADEHMAQLDLLESCGGVDYFLWTDPRGRQGKYVCREWSGVQVKPGVYEVSCKFEEVFDL